MLIHTPRTLHAVAKGLIRRRANGKTADLGGMGHENPFISYNRASIFDCDYMMHMNNAAYLSHAEYARWELCAYNGLMNSMFRDNVHFMVGNTAVRYRREIRPIFRAFQIHTYVAKLDERSIWMYHTFRYPPGGKDPGRIRAQVLCQGLAVHNRKVIDPRDYFKDKVGFPPEVVDAISQPSHSDDNSTIHALLDNYAEMEGLLKNAASEDDEALAKKG